MFFNNIDLSPYLKINAVRGRGIVPSELTLIEVPGRHGAYFSNKRKPPRTLEVDYTITASTRQELREKIGELNAIFNVSEPVPIVFDDEPGYTYYGIPESAEEKTEFVRVHQGTITFVCPDPYKYGLEKEALFPSDVVSLNYGGTADGDPVFELEVTDPVTFAVIQNQDEEYMMIGRPADVEQEVVNSRVLVLDERGDTLSSWMDSPTQVDSPYSNVDGQMGTDGTGIVPLDYGTGTRWHGPALIKEIPPIQDFEVEMRCRVELTDVNQTFRIEFYLFDEYFNVLGKMAVMDATVRYNDIVAEGRYGEYRGDHSNYLIYSQNYSRKIKHFHGLVRMRRIGQRFEFYVARLTDGAETPTHFDQFEEVWNDIGNQYQGRLRYVQIHIGKYADSGSALVPRINSIKVYELKSVTQNQTPYIAYPGDVITFDHSTSNVLINGESRMDLKQFGASFFKLKPGQNQFVVMPDNSFSVKVRYKERFL